MGRLYLALGLLAALGLAWWRYDYVTTQWQAEKTRADQATEDYTTAKAKLDTERQNAAAADLRAKQRLTEKEAIENELREKNKCIDAGTCGVIVRWKSAICAGESVRSSDTSASGFNDVQIQDQRDFARWLANLEHSIELDERAIEGFKKELEVRAKADYCKIK